MVVLISSLCRHQGTQQSNINDHIAYNLLCRAKWLEGVSILFSFYFPVFDFLTWSDTRAHLSHSKGIPFHTLEKTKTKHTSWEALISKCISYLIMTKFIQFAQVCFFKDKVKSGCHVHSEMALPGNTYLSI